MHTLQRVLTAFTLALAVTPALLAQRQPAAPRLIQKTDSAHTLPWLEARLPDVNLEDVPLEGVLEYLGNYAETNVVVRWSVLEGFSIRKETPISLKVKNLKLSQVLWLVLNQIGGTDVRLAYRATGNLLLISTADDLGREMIVKIYDVSDLLAHAPDFTGPSVDVSRSETSHGSVFTGQGNSASAEESQGRASRAETDVQRLIEMIQTVIAPDSWQKAGGRGTIQGYGAKIAVLNTIEVHEKLGGYLREPD